MKIYALILENDFQEMYDLTWSPLEMREWLNTPAVKQNWVMNRAYSFLKDDCLSFQSGIALYGISAKDHRMHDGIIDQAGNILHQFGTKVYSVKLFQNGFTIAKPKKGENEKYGYLSEDGSFCIAPI